MSNRVLESKIESYLKELIGRIGGLAYKFKSTVNGVPDQLIIYDGCLYLVEVKRPDEKPRVDQQHVHSQIKKRGVTVYTISTQSEVETFIRETLNAGIPPKKQRKKPKIHTKTAFKLQEKDD